MVNSSHPSSQCASGGKSSVETCWRQTPRSPTPKHYRILVIRGGMKTMAVRRDFDCCFLGFRVLVWDNLGVRVLGFRFFRVLGFAKY